MIDEVLQSVSRSKSPIDKGTASTFSSTEENYQSILDRYNSMKKQLDESTQRRR